MNFLRTVIFDRKSSENTELQWLFISMLSEIYRNQGHLLEALELWKDMSDNLQDILQEAGPRPLVEYAYCLAEWGDMENAKAISELLSSAYSNYYIVHELETNLNNVW